MGARANKTQALRQDTAIDLPKLASDLAEHGAIEISAAQLPIAWPVWERLEELSNALPYEEIVEGDAGDKHTVWVGRFMNDVKRPTLLHHSSAEVIELLTSPELMSMYKAFAGRDELCVRRCQVNLLRENGFVGLHIDQDANPDYLLAVVLHLTDDYEGGEYLVHAPTSGTHRFKPQAPSMLIGRGDIPHEVTRVTSGVRKTLVFFLSTNFGDTKITRTKVTSTERELITDY